MGQVGRMIRIKAEVSGPCQRETLRADEVGQRVELGSDQHCSSAFNVLREPGGNRTEYPHGPSRCSNGDRTMAVFHRRVGLAPYQRGLPALQGGFVGQARGPASTKGGDLIELGWIKRQFVGSAAGP